ncbi:solute carrier family 15 member 1-like isoform X2 [Aphis craccivora]|uniref:Solute carrier family 15 member 1-like isoform X2 n=1 Tax=Aphis craccivora TaxID=307492 RepID=A0A6G0ZBD3_APHCR|nr:solute carrier family 15 member 1-like isoform X2 [Aphis craccivora]
MTTKYPKSIWYIIGNEFCERFSYYGLKAILVLFFTTIQQYDHDTSTSVHIYHHCLVLSLQIRIGGNIMYLYNIALHAYFILCVNVNQLQIRFQRLTSLGFKEVGMEKPFAFHL